MVDVAGLVLRQLAGLAEPELRVAGGGLAPRGVPAVELGRKSAKRRRLELVEARVVADELELLLVARAVEAEQPDAVGERGVVGRDEAAVAEAEEVLRREEAERARDAERADRDRRGGAEGLRGVLDRPGSPSGSSCERGRAAEEVRRRGSPSCAP